MSKIDEIRNLIFDYGGTDGAHHNQWLLDQILRKSFDSKEEYDEWIKQYEFGEDGSTTYLWDVGIIP